MQKRVSIAIGAISLLTLGLLFWFSLPRRSRANRIVSGHPSAAFTGGRASEKPQDQRFAPAASARSGADAGSIPCLVPPAVLHPGRYLMDGGLPPNLSSSAPSLRRFGVVVVRYRGAQGAGKDARTKKKALSYARSLLPLAKTDFAAAVRFGDSGSSEDVGSVPRDVLEPAPNYLLFSAKPGEVIGPVDTPTGFWIVKVLR